MKILFIAGPNGAGKTTFAREYLKEEGNAIPFVNGDDIAAQLRPDNPVAAALQAGRIALRRMEAYAAKGMDFAVETTLSGRASAPRIRRWREKGYGIALIYLRLPSTDHSVERVARRVREGGHAIPEATVRRRFKRSWRNFGELYRNLADEWQVYGTARPALVLVDSSHGSLIVPAPRDGWRVRERTGGTTARAAASSTRQAAPSRSSAMTDASDTAAVGTLPPGEPSVESVLAALARAREVALARAEAGRGHRAGRAPSDRESSANNSERGSLLVKSQGERARHE